MKNLSFIIIQVLFVFQAVSQNLLMESDSLFFDGGYVGINAGSQNVFGGSFVNGMDILAQESKFVTEVTIGYRWQFLKKRMIVGLQYQLGFLKGDLTHEDQRNQLQINYSNSFQSGFGGTLGFTLDGNKRWMILGYLNETKRKFMVDVRQAQWRFSQTDKQGMLKYGIGLEYQLLQDIGIRITFGKLRVDFGDHITNIDVDDKYDFTLGVIYRL